MKKYPNWLSNRKSIFHLGYLEILSGRPTVCIFCAAFKIYCSICMSLVYGILSSLCNVNWRRKPESGRCDAKYVLNLLYLSEITFANGSLYVRWCKMATITNRWILRLMVKFNYFVLIEYGVMMIILICITWRSHLIHLSVIYQYKVPTLKNFNVVNYLIVGHFINPFKRNVLALI